MKYQYDYSQSGERRLIQDASRNIVRINAHIHTGKFSSDYLFDDIRKSLGPLKINNKLKYNKNYDDVAIRKTEAQDYKLYFNPVDGIHPMTYLEIYGETLNHKTIADLYEKLPNLKVSQLEYTIDLFCEDHIAVAHLFYLLRRHLYFPYAKKTSMSGGSYSWLDLNRSTNSVFEINYKSRSWSAKLYERGPDKLKKPTPVKRKKRWKHKDCDRVRLEITIKRPKLYLKKPKSIAELLINSGFLQLLKPPTKSKRSHFHFKCFKPNNKKLPRPYDEYTAKDAKGNSESFQEEYSKAKKIFGNNTSRHIEENKELNSLRKKIINAVEVFDKNWIRKTKASGLIDLHGKYI